VFVQFSRETTTQISEEILKMDQVWFVAALWLLLALVAVLVANWLKVATALSEIVVGTVAQVVIGAIAGGAALGAKAP
jgi:glutathione-regulated potassium-efflux system ancillary protein KefC